MKRPFTQPSAAKRRPDRRSAPPGLAGALVLLLGLALLSGCRGEMHNQPAYRPMDRSEFFQDHGASRHPPPHTLPRGTLPEDRAVVTGMSNGVFVSRIPVPVTSQLLARGQERYGIYCAPCHGATGEGNGIVVQRGFPAPPSYHSERLRSARAGHFFDVITHGFGVMYPYRARLTPEDRWAVIAYIRALQLSRRAPLDAAPPANQRELLEAKR